MRQPTSHVWLAVISQLDPRHVVIQFEWLHCGCRDERNYQETRVMVPVASVYGLWDYVDGHGGNIYLWPGF